MVALVNLNSVTKRLVIGVHDAVALVTIVAIMSCGLPAELAYAYVDPSVMTYTIQAVAGVAVALSAVAGVAFRRTRKALFNLLKIDENANKEIERAVSRVEPNAENVVRPASDFASDGRSEDGGKGDSDAKGAAKVAWPIRFAIAIIVSAFTVGTLLVVAPYELVAASEGSLVYGLHTVWEPVALFGLIVFAVAAIVLSLFWKRGFFVAASLVFSFGLGCWVQAMFLNGGLPLANGMTLDLWDAKKITVLSTLVWLAIIAAPLVVGFKTKRFKAVEGGMVLCSLALIIVQGVGVASLFANAAEDDVPESAEALSSYVMTREGINSVSADKHNVVVFVLDTVDTQFLLDCLEAHPNMLDEYTGFTWYKDSAGSMVPTRYGNVFLLTGVMPEYGEDWETFLKRRYDDNAYLQFIKGAGYSIGLYTDTLGVNWVDDDKARAVYDTTFNIRPLTREERSFNAEGAVRSLTKCALYRDLPWLLKPFFWFYTDEVNRAMVETSTVSTGANNEPYVIDDAKWLDDLQEQGITAADEHAENGSFRFIHLLGTHWPYSLNEVGDFVGTNEVTLDQQTQGTMYGVAEYLRYLKASGAYDNTTIIVTADHGDYYPVYGSLDKPASPIVLYKPAQSADLDAQPLKISNAPVEAHDLLATVLDSMGYADEAAKYGIPVDQIPEDEFRPRRFLATMFNEHDSTRDGDVLEYYIDGYVLDWSHWHFTGEVWNHVDYE